MPQQPPVLLPRLLAASVLPCAFAALVLTGVLTVQEMRGADHMAQMAIDDAMRPLPAHALQRIDVEEADGSQLHGGVSTVTSSERHRREHAGNGGHRAVVMHVDTRTQQRTRQRVLLYGMLVELALVSLAMLGASALRHRVSMPLQRLQHELDTLLHGDSDRTTMVRTEPYREFAQLHASVAALASLLNAQREERSPVQHVSAIEDSDHLRPSQAAMHDKSQFIALVGHHFRQPMQALHLLTASLHPGINEEQQTALSQVRASIATMTRLLDALLEIARLDAGVVAAASGQFSITDLFLHDRAPLLECARQQQVSVMWRQSWYRLCGDISLASLLLYQLASNAIAHAGPLGRVLIAARRVDGGVRVEVRDSGPGIAAIHQQRIFEEFVQLQGEGERHGGYGLGLAIAARLAKILDTEIGLRSEPGRGSTFWFELPRVPAHERTGISRRSEWLHPIG